MDLSDTGGIDQLGYAISQRHGRLDILVHAAAMLGGLRPVAHIPPVLWDKILATNLTSVFGLIRSLEPLLRASDSVAGDLPDVRRGANPRAFWGSYAATKAGLEALVRCWADEVDSSTDPGDPAQPRARCAPRCAPRPFRARTRTPGHPGDDRELAG